MVGYIKLFKRAAALGVSLAAAASCITANAEVLGELTDSSWLTHMGSGVVYWHNVFKSSSVGLQTENYIEYSPDPSFRPIVVNGDSVWGKRNIRDAVGYMARNDMRPLAGINADYFSFKTGIPMGYTIIDGRIFSKESGIQDAVGFRRDGSGFIDKLSITTTLTHGDMVMEVPYINKWAQNSFDWMYMLTDDFGGETHTDFEALYVICTPLEGELTVECEIPLAVDEVFIYDGAIAIPDGKYVFVIDVDGYEDYVDTMSRLAPGDRLTLKNTLSGAERYDWTEAEYALSSMGGRLINNGVLGSGFEAGTSPRSAVGVTGDGRVIFYTIDGRQSGYSYGCRIDTLARRMEEIGCVDAINLDGGGSTSIGAIFPGSSSFTLSNKPSDGAMRSCANYLFLQDLRTPTDDPWYVEWSIPRVGNTLSGVKMRFRPDSVYDSGNYKMSGLQNVDFAVENSGGAQTTTDDEGNVEFAGEGHSVISVSGSAYYTDFAYEVYDAPEEVRVTDRKTGAPVTELVVDEDGDASYSLAADAYVNGVKLLSEPEFFDWKTEGSIASAEGSRITLRDDGSEEAFVVVTCRGVSARIPVVIREKDTFEDIASHWAHDIIENMAERNIINGIDAGGHLIFMPDSSITRIQFAAIMCKTLGINAAEYSGVQLPFTDSADIQPWAVDYVKAMYSLGYISGRSDDGGKTLYLAPDSGIIRSEAFAIMSRAIPIDRTAVLDYSDTADIPLWAQSAAAKLTALGVVRGSYNMLYPNSMITRAEAATLISNSENYFGGE